MKDFTLERIPRGENSSADALAALATTSDSLVKRIIPVERIDKSSIYVTLKAEAANKATTASAEQTESPPQTSCSEFPPKAIMVCSAVYDISLLKNRPVPETLVEKESEPEELDAEFLSRPDWREPILDYIRLGLVPNDKWEARKLKS